MKRKSLLACHTVAKVRKVMSTQKPVSVSELIDLDSCFDGSAEDLVPTHSAGYRDHG